MSTSSARRLCRRDQAPHPPPAYSGKKLGGMLKMMGVEKVGTSEDVTYSGTHSLSLTAPTSPIDRLRRRSHPPHQPPAYTGKKLKQNN